ncbi:DOLK [Cordylochernes scorpioides]|uniref:dolichol kinase n=1 Tax=Cordylochernes scorpioides TaxID=51811 RepID=A0ABY6LKY7_9ARAC|nr:DOLK [Cordylochernes scorpioides]
MHQWPNTMAKSHHKGLAPSQSRPDLVLVSDAAFSGSLTVGLSLFDWILHSVVSIRVLFTMLSPPADEVDACCGLIQVLFLLIALVLLDMILCTGLESMSIVGVFLQFNKFCQKSLFSCLDFFKAVFNPNGIRRNLYLPKGVQNVVRFDDSSESFTFQKPSLVSTTVIGTLLGACLMVQFRKVFSLGQSTILSNASGLIFLQNFLNALFSPFTTNALSLAVLIVLTALSAKPLLCGCLILYFAKRANIVFNNARCLVYGFGILLPLGTMVLNENPFLWLINFVSTPSRMTLMAVWALLTGLTVAYVAWKNMGHAYSSTSIRKVFHFVTTAIILAGVLDPELLTLATGGVLLVFIGIETLRILNFPPLGQHLVETYSIFADEKDTGLVILTPLYLLFGCAFPFWLNLDKKTELCHLAGILTIGIGDSAASIGGTRLGRHQFPGTKKSYEGFACNALSQLVVALVFYSYVLKSPVTWWVVCKMALCCGASAVVETCTTQVDNLVLPIMFYPLWRLLF